MGLSFGVSQVLVSGAVIGLVELLLQFYDALVAKPRRLRSALAEQGVRGPPPTLLLGNNLEIKKGRDEAAAAAKVSAPSDGTVPPAHNCGSLLFPFADKWRNQYGEVFVFSLGSTRILCVTQPDLVKEIATCTSLDLGKPAYQVKERGSLLGRGILTSSGAIWAHQRKILAPEFYMDKVKGMINLVQESAITMVNGWKDTIEAGGGIADIQIDEHLRIFSGDVISRACFGSSKSEEIFIRLRALQEVESKKLLATGIPGMSRFCVFFHEKRASRIIYQVLKFCLKNWCRHLPSKSNREAWQLEKEIKTLILQIVNERIDQVGHEKDLLQLVLEGARNSELSKDAIDRFIVDNCKNIYFAGYETTAVSASWRLMLLASNPEWQERIRAEVVEICKGQVPDDDMIRKMKQLTMAINESLRLYPPAIVVSREALKDIKFGDVKIPQGVNIWTMVTTLHTDPGIWGPDSYEFNPGRFADGITGACKFPHLYMPFGLGPRVCLGHNLAMVELKVLISMILANFSFSISPKYKHSPALHLVIAPEHGVNLLFKKLYCKDRKLGSGLHH